MQAKNAPLVECQNIVSILGVKVPEGKQETSRKRTRSSLKIYVSERPMDLKIPEDRMMNGVSPKLVISEGEESGIIKRDISPLEELVGAKVMRGVFEKTIGYKGLAPENSLVVARVLSEGNKSVLIYSKYLQENFITLHKQRCVGENKMPLRNVISAPLWQEFLQYTALSIFVYGNGDLNDRNIGIITKNNVEHIAALDFGYIFYISTPESGGKAFCQFMHMMLFWHQVEGFTPDDISIIKNCLSEFYQNRIKHLHDLAEVLHIVCIDCEKVKKYGCDMKKPLHERCMLEYTPNNERQASPLLWNRLKIRHCGRSFRAYVESIRECFLANVALIPEVLLILDRITETGVEIRPSLYQQEIDFDYFTKFTAAEERKRSEAAEGSIATLK